MTKKPSLGQVARSVLSAAIGVQSDKNRVKDFESPTIWPFVIGGVIFTALFVVGLIAIVSLVA